MSKHISFYDTVYEIINDGVNKGILHLNTEDKQLVGNIVHVNNNPIVNFGSCSYLGLEFENSMKEAAKRAIDDYGTQFSASRAYMSSRHYVELEEKFESILGTPSLVAPTTTLGHIATIPLIINDDDAIILDHQVHNSVQTAVGLVRPRGVCVEMIRHNNMQMLEDKIKVLRQKYKRIWYMADGIYSMYGDCTPIDEVYMLMDKYPELHYYVDDAHGMSCFGKHGRGYVLSKHEIHEKMAFTTSLAKAFATGGAVISFADKKLVNKIRSCGGPMLSSGPMQPAALGAAIASADIHLSEEIYNYQSKLHENIKFCNMMLNKAGLPLVSESATPVFFVGVSLPKMAYNMIQRLLKEGYYLNMGIFPTVPIKNTGLRFTITSLHTFKQIEDMVSAMAYHFPLALEEEGFSLNKIYQAFKMPNPEEKVQETKVDTLISQSLLKEQYTDSIENIDALEWDELVGSRSSYSADGLRFLEKSFGEKLENNWKFDYIIIRDPSGKPVLATFLTTSLCKDDLLAPSSVSKQIEEIRKNDPGYLTSTTIMMGSQLTEGEHLYLDRNSKYWKDALKLLFERINELQEMYNAPIVILRDFHKIDAEFDSIFVDNGYFKVNTLDAHVLDLSSWNTKDDYLAMLSTRSRKHLRNDVLRHEDLFEVKIEDSISNDKLKDLYELYLNVKERSYTINTFTLTFEVFKNLAKDKNWEVLCLYFKDKDNGPNKKPLAVFFSFVGETTYNPLIIGIDYTLQEEFKCYKQIIYQMILRAKSLGKAKINMGFGASSEKKKFGAELMPTYSYMQAKDNYNLNVIASMNILETVNHLT